MTEDSLEDGGLGRRQRTRDKTEGLVEDRRLIREDFYKFLSVRFDWR